MAKGNNKSIRFSVFIFVVLVVLVEGRLNSKYARSGPPEKSKAQHTENDQCSWQLSNGGARPKETTTVCGLASEEQRFGQGGDLQIIQRNINTCGIRSVPRSTANTAEQRGMPCKATQICMTIESSVEELALLDGHREVTSALSCRCLDPRRPCHRETNVRVFHWGTTYEKTIDVGRCIGSCTKGKKTCRAIDTKVVTVKGPNGANCVKKVLRCGCVRSCFRASFRQVYTATVFDEEAKTNKTLEEVVDIGRCVGECPTTNKGRCLHWVANPLWHPGSNLPPKVCMLSLPSGKTGGKCRPSSFEARVLFAVDGAPKSVNALKRCKCY